MLKKVFLSLFLVCPFVSAEKTKTTYNPFTSKLDYITTLDTTSIKAGSNITVTTTSTGVQISGSAGGGSTNGTIAASPTYQVGVYSLPGSSTTVTGASNFIVTSSSIGITSPTTISTLGVTYGLTVSSINTSIIMADQMPGADFGAKINAAIAATPLTGGVVDARGLNGTQNFTTPIVINKSGTHIILGSVAALYCGNSDAWNISSDSNAVNVVRYNTIEGAGVLQTFLGVQAVCTSTPTAVVHIKWSTHDVLKDMSIYATSGTVNATTGLWDQQNDDVELSNVVMGGNKTAPNVVGTSVWRITGSGYGHYKRAYATGAEYSMILESTGTSISSVLISSLGYTNNDGNEAHYNTFDDIQFYSAFKTNMLLQCNASGFSVKNNHFYGVRTEFGGQDSANTDDDNGITLQCPTRTGTEYIGYNLFSGVTLFNNYAHGMLLYGAVFRNTILGIDASSNGLTDTALNYGVSLKTNAALFPDSNYIQGMIDAGLAGSTTNQAFGVDASSQKNKLQLYIRTSTYTVANTLNDISVTSTTVITETHAGIQTFYNTVQFTTNTILGAGTTFYQDGSIYTGLTASLPVQTNSASKLTASAIDLSGSQATGTMAAGREPAHTGDVTNSAGSLAMTAAAVQANIATLSSTSGVQVTSNTILSGATFYQNGPILLTTNVGIGTSAPIFPVHVITTNTVTSGSNVGLFSSYWANPTGASSNITQAIVGDMESAPGNLFNISGTMIGVSAQAIHNGQGTLTNAIGGSYIGNNASTSTVTNSIAVNPQIKNTNTGTTTNAYGVFVSAPVVSAGAITTYTGIFVNTPAAAATNYGAVILGKTGIGSAAPAYRLVTIGAIADNYTATFGTSTVAGFHVAISTQAHMIYGGPIPTISTCGSTPNGSVVGTDNGGAITIGGGSVTACTLTFAKSWGVTPVCTISDGSTTITPDISAISATAFTASFSASIGGGTLYYQCSCHQGVSCL